MENESADGHVIVAFGKVEGEHFVHLLYFESCREYVFTAVGFLCHVVVAVVFVFDVAENFFYNIFKVNYSILTGALTLSIMVLPTIIRTTQEAIKTVPMGYREGAIGLGAAKWHTIRTVVLPSCIDGILTSVILSIGRIVGESAALIFTAGIAAEIGINSIGDIFTKVMDQGGSLTVQLYQYAQRGGAEMKYAFSTALVLLVTVLVINICAKLVAYRIRKKRSA